MLSQYKSLAAGSTVNNLNKELVGGAVVSTPEREEQSQLGNFFERLDFLIALHQRKYEKLQNLKNAFLERMFPVNGEKFPRIRFVGFTDAWEQHKLRDIGSAYSGLTGKTREDFGHGTAKFITYMNVFSNPTCSQELQDAIEVDSRQNEVEVGDAFFTISSETPEEVGLSSVLLEKTGTIYLNSFCFGFRPIEKLDNYFLAHMLRSKGVRKQIVRLAQGISRYNISKNKVLDTEIFFPGQREQRQIGEICCQLDKLLSLHQRKHNTYSEEESRSQLPKNNYHSKTKQLEPSSQTWEQHKLRDIGSAYSGLTGKTREDFGHGTAKFITYMNVFSNPTCSQELQDAIEVDSRQNEVEVGDAFFTISSETPEEVGLSSVLLEKTGTIYLNSFCFGFRPIEKLDNYFLAHMLRSKGVRKQIVRLAQGISRYNISKNKVLDTEIFFPGQREQRQIGEICCQLDKLLSLHQRNDASKDPRKKNKADIRSKIRH